MIEELYKLREARPQKYANKEHKAVRRRSKDTRSHSVHITSYLCLTSLRQQNYFGGDNVEETAHTANTDFLFYLDQHKTWL